MSYDQSLEVMRERWENEIEMLEERIEIQRQIADEDLRPATMSDEPAPF